MTSLAWGFERRAVRVLWALLNMVLQCVWESMRYVLLCSIVDDRERFKLEKSILRSRDAITEARPGECDETIDLVTCSLVKLLCPRHIKAAYRVRKDEKLKNQNISMPMTKVHDIYLPSILDLHVWDALIRRPIHMFMLLPYGTPNQ